MDATFSVQEGRLIGAHGSNPFDAVSLRMAGGDPVYVVSEPGTLALLAAGLLGLLLSWRRRRAA